MTSEYRLVLEIKKNADKKSLIRVGKHTSSDTRHPGRSLAGVTG